MSHGSLSSPDQFMYIRNTEDAESSMHHQETKLSFVGHCQKPAVFSKSKKGLAGRLIDEVVIIDDNQTYLVNVGSIGQPRDGDWRACYCIFDDVKHTISFKRLEYDVEVASNAILRSNLPENLALRLKKGR